MSLNISSSLGLNDTTTGSDCLPSFEWNGCGGVLIVSVMVTFAATAFFTYNLDRYIRRGRCPSRCYKTGSLVHKHAVQREERERRRGAQIAERSKAIADNIRRNESLQQQQQQQQQQQPIPSNYASPPSHTLGDEAEAYFDDDESGEQIELSEEQMQDEEADTTSVSHIASMMLTPPSNLPGFDALKTPPAPHAPPS
jgi:hypothetical protein